MSLGFVTVLLLVFAAVAVLAVIAGVVLTVVGKNDDPSLGARRRIRILYGIAAAVGAGFALLVVFSFPTIYVNSTEVPGLLAALGPAMAGIVYVDIAAFGEAFWPKPKGERRGAYLTRRPALANAAAVPMWACVVWGVLLTAFLTFFGIVATDDGESPGRSIAHPVWNPSVGGSSGPFPGWPYGIPMLVLTGVLVLFALGVLHVIARRPAVGGTTPEDDAALRRISATNLVKGVQLSLAASLAGVLLIGGIAARSGGVVVVDGYYATLIGHWWAVPVILLAFVVLISSIAVLAWRTK